MEVLKAGMAIDVTIASVYLIPALAIRAPPANRAARPIVNVSWPTRVGAEEQMISTELKKTILGAESRRWEFDEQTTASQVPGWDSLSHVNVILAVENGLEFVSATSKS